MDYKLNKMKANQKNNFQQTNHINLAKEQALINNTNGKIGISTIITLYMEAMARKI